MSACPFCDNPNTTTDNPLGYITHIRCDFPGGCGALVSFRARASRAETLSLYASRNDPSIREGYAKALSKVGN